MKVSGVSIDDGTHRDTQRDLTTFAFVSASNGEVTYSLSALNGAPGAAEFSIEPATGVVRVAAPLDAETRAAYHLRVIATDAGRPPLHSTAHLFITGECRRSPRLLATSSTGERR